MSFEEAKELLKEAEILLERNQNWWAEEQGELARRIERFLKRCEA